MEFGTIGSALSSRRNSLSLDQARAAAIIGMSRTTFSSYERDLQRPSAEVLPSLAQFLEISIDEVLTLYGGTCIEALRPSLERFLSTYNANATDPPATEKVGLCDPIPVATPKDASLSIFANELSIEMPRLSTSSSTPPNSDRRDSKGVKSKGGKKKKGKKHKR